MTTQNAVDNTITGNAGTVTNATLTTAITVNTGTVTLKGNVANTSVLTIGAGAVSISGANTGDQTAIAGIAGTKAQFDTAVTDGNFLYVGDVTQYTDELAQDAVGGMVNTSLTYTDGTPLLGLTSRTIGGVAFDGTANITVATATGGFTVSGGALALGANDLTMTGSLGATGARLTKGWFTDLQVTNAIAGSITGNAATVTVADAASDTTTWVLLGTSQTGSLAPATDGGITYNASTNALTATTFVGALTGNATTATALATPRTIGGVSFDGSANIVPQTIQSVNEATDTTCFPLFISASGTQSLQPLNNTALTFNSNTGALGATLLGGTLTTVSQTNITGVGAITTGTWNATDIAVADGGTGRSTSTTAYALIAAGTTATGAHQTLAAGATTEILVGGGASALPVWTTATGTGAPVRAGSPTFTGTPILSTASATSLATSAATPLLLTNGQLVNIALTSQTTGATTLTIPDFASVVDEFTFKTKAQTMSNKTFVAPALGTPASGVLTNCTGLPTTGLVDAAVTLAKMTNLAQDQFIGRTTASTGVPETATITAAARTVLDDTTVGAMVDTLGGASASGTGGLVRITSAALTTPNIGTPSAGVLTSCTGLPLTTGVTGVLPEANGGAQTSAWTNFTPTITSQSGTLTTVSGDGYYKQIGKTVYFKATATITTNGTGATGIQFTLPVQAHATHGAAALSGRETSAVGFGLTAAINQNATTTIAYKASDSTYPGGSGYVLTISGVYESI